ncbi:cation:proton antiporter [Phycicoccus sp. CSK15P-2]|uniref:cation:proton antiporter family protein n=1 Tax=Phycicoccus sp. CSK15P-2 TaxID=2807627 RepID=UPI001950BC4F|nr:cation:proton antiporter family protein [Phycicoccus sp. CSK15P-2]MBM6406120.1 cation:proton antiporter [Phycicoccus sp. CSK15P-2]
MDATTAILLAALVGGLVASAVRLPPLVGFLVAGFALRAGGIGPQPFLDVMADLGVTVLLFAVGLKVDVRGLLRREVWGTATAHLVGSTLAATGALAALGTLGLGLTGDGTGTWLLVGFALSFSSTVVVIKVLEERGTSRSFGGRTAIGILVVQDVAAVLFLATAEARPPSPWAVLLVLVVPGAVLLRRVLGVVGHGELLALFGVVVALAPGYALFDAAGVKGDLGALVMGMLLAGHATSDELSKSIFALKDLLLVGFFVAIGLGGLPSATELALGLALLLLLPLKALGFAALLWLAGLRRRTAVLTGVALANFSEFGLIVLALAPEEMLAPEWIRVVATAVAASFVLTSLPGRHPEYLSHALRRLLPDRPVGRTHPEDRPLDLGAAGVAVLGMGRVGRSAYERLSEGYGLRVVGVEASRERCRALAGEGFVFVEADATDPEIWADRPFGHIDLVVLAMPFHGNNLDALEQLRGNGYGGTVAVVAQHDDDLATAMDGGAHTGLQLYDGAGAELADRAAAVLGRPARDLAPPEDGAGERPGRTTE